MVFAAGVQKRVIYKKESTYGVSPGPTGGEYFRRVESSLALNKDTYESQEIRPDYQIADFRHGVRRVGGNLRAELSLNSFEQFFAAVLRRDFAAGASYDSSGGAISFDGSNTITQDDNSSWIAKGFRVGDILTITGATDSNLNGLILRVTGFADNVGTADDMTVAETVPTSAAEATATIAVKGFKTYVPTSGHTSDSFTIEQHHADTDDSRVFTGCHVAGANFQLPPTGLAMLDFPMVGQNMVTYADANAPHFTAPTAANTNSILASVNGSLRLAGTDVGTLTGLDINIETPWTADPVVGSNVLPQFFPGRTRVSGQFSAYFENDDMLNDFLAETEREMQVKIDAPNGTDFFSIFLPRIKLGGAPENDGEGGLIQNVPFMALLKQGVSGYDDTTIVLQDSTLS